jgi:hypothetical protein
MGSRAHLAGAPSLDELIEGETFVLGVQLGEYRHYSLCLLADVPLPKGGLAGIADLAIALAIGCPLREMAAAAIPI